MTHNDDAGQYYLERVVSNYGYKRGVADGRRKVAEAQ